MAEFDAIVVGSGISGGWAAKEFAEKGMKTLIIERGRHVEHIDDYITEGIPPWELALRDEVDHEIEKIEHPIQSQCFAFKETSRHFFA
ncbi:MAG: FAD-binding protein, partial [Kordiimonadaceae bacterium]|nr:FAD-binding protein [Kordiimonadaceae bacterium]